MTTAPDPQAALTEALAISLLRAGTDTQPARLLKDLGLNRPETGLLARVAEAIYPDPASLREVIRRVSADVERALKRPGKPGRHLVPWWEAGYPELLRSIADPPPVLWVDGDVASLSLPAVALVGSRRATPASIAVARRLAAGLVQAGLAVVSGLALGVDGAAHAGALDAGGRTVAVLGSGLDVIYPWRHVRLASAVVRTGAVVSELPPWARPWPSHFPLRNRLISGLSRAVVVVEASERSGSLITARMALEQGRDVLAVPGGILSDRHRGSNRLIKDGARLVETVEDILEEIGWADPRRAGKSAADSKSLPISSLADIMAAGEAYSVEDLAGQTGRRLPDLLADLSNLELSGEVVRQESGLYVRLPGSR